jgi:hypothetical protein
MRLKDLIFEESYYSGTTMSKNTSIVGGVTEGISSLFKSGKIFGKVLDYGAGRVDRNAKFLRENGLEVYSYDPFWGSGDNGYETTSDKLPNDTFDVGYTSYVLNVVSVPEQSGILNTMNSLCKKQYHIVRYMDLYDLAKKNLESDKDNVLKSFFTKEYKGNIEQYLNSDKEARMNILTDFLQYGTETSNGFQRLVSLEDQGFSLIKKASGYRIYEK